MVGSKIFHIFWENSWCPHDCNIYFNTSKFQSEDEGRWEFGTSTTWKRWSELNVTRPTDNTLVSRPRSQETWKKRWCKKINLIHSCFNPLSYLITSYYASWHKVTALNRKDVAFLFFIQAYAWLDKKDNARQIIISRF